MKKQGLKNPAGTCGIVLRFEEARRGDLSEITIFAGSAEAGDTAAEIHECGKMVLLADVWRAMVVSMDRDGFVLEKGTDFTCESCGESHRLDGEFLFDCPVCPSCGLAPNHACNRSGQDDA